MSVHLPIQPLTASAFARFGEVIETTGTKPLPINHGQSLRFDDLANLQLDADGGRPVVSIFRTAPLPEPIILQQMECHALGSQAFIPLGGNPWLVVVAPKGQFNPTTMQAFLASSKQGVNFHPGTWHHFSLALEAVSEFLVIDRKCPGDDCQEITLDPPIQLAELS